MAMVAMDTSIAMDMDIPTIFTAMVMIFMATMVGSEGSVLEADSVEDLEDSIARTNPDSWITSQRI